MYEYQKEVSGLARDIMRHAVLSRDRFSAGDAGYEAYQDVLMISGDLAEETDVNKAFSLMAAMSARLNQTAALYYPEILLCANNLYAHVYASLRDCENAAKARLAGMVVCKRFSVALRRDVKWFALRAAALELHAFYLAQNHEEMAEQYLRYAYRPSDTLEDFPAFIIKDIKDRQIVSADYPYPPASVIYSKGE
jgi:hypothetical protein